MATKEVFSQLKNIREGKPVEAPKKRPTREVLGRLADITGKKEVGEKARKAARAIPLAEAIAARKKAPKKKKVPPLIKEKPKEVEEKRGRGMRTILGGAIAAKPRKKVVGAVEAVPPAEVKKPTKKPKGEVMRGLAAMKRPRGKIMSSLEQVAVEAKPEEKEKILRQLQLLRLGKLSPEERETLLKKLRITSSYYKANKDKLQEDIEKWLAQKLKVKKKGK